MKTRRFVVLSCLITVCAISFALADAQDTKKDNGVDESPVDQMLRDFASAVSNLDAKQAEALFLAPDDTPDGKNRQSHLQEMKKDWKRAGEREQKMTVIFKDTVTTVRTEMLIGGDEAEAEPIPVEFKVVFTKDGCKIVAMKYLKT